jgi:hypothetical protein
MTTPTLEELAADLATLKTQVPIHEELLFSTILPCWNNAVDKLTNANAISLLVAPIPLRVLSCALSFEYWSLAASDSAYWTMTLSRGNTSGYTDIAARSTQNTGANANGGITARKAWTFDAAAWGDAELAAGDLLRLTVAPTGTVAAWDMPVTATIRYRPL